jgi:hypothetical protein
MEESSCSDHVDRRERRRPRGTTSKAAEEELDRQHWVQIGF